jgi:hypothetical protein
VNQWAPSAALGSPNTAMPGWYGVYASNLSPAGSPAICARERYGDPVCSSRMPASSTTSTSSCARSVRPPARWTASTTTGTSATRTQAAAVSASRWRRTANTATAASR